MRRYGFNFQWMFSWEPGRAPEAPNERALDFMAAHGFNFVRVPTDYRFWTKDFDYLNPDERVFEAIDSYLEACRSRGMQMSLNLHRAPGYCINGNDLERHNLWLDAEAQEGFVKLWEGFAKRYAGVSSETLSFDLVNEPPEIDQYGMTRGNHATLIRRAVAAIRGVDTHREIAIDGLGGGNIAMPELADLGVTHSGRAYQPYPVSHWGASWWDGWKAGDSASYPGTNWDGKTWNLETLREFYQPWREVEALGAKVHIGEFGCYNQTPNDTALRWFADLFRLFKEFRWGYALWDFEGAFGIVNHGRPDAKYEKIHGFNVDAALLELMLEGRVE
jgi:endoglucanase